MKKRILSVFLVLALMLALLPAQAVAAGTGNGDADEAAAEAPGDESPIQQPIDYATRKARGDEPVHTGTSRSVNWKLYSDGTLYIVHDGDESGQHTMGAASGTDWSTSPQWAQYAEDYGPFDVVIEQGWSNVGKGVFNLDTSIRSVTIPDSVMSIDEQAFDRATNLQKVFWDGRRTGGMMSFGKMAFYQNALEEFQFPEGADQYVVSQQALCELKNPLEELVFPENTILGEWVLMHTTVKNLVLSPNTRTDNVSENNTVDYHHAFLEMFADEIKVPQELTLKSADEYYVSNPNMNVVGTVGSSAEDFAKKSLVYFNGTFVGLDFQLYVKSLGVDVDPSLYTVNWYYPGHNDVVSTETSFHVDDPTKGLECEIVPTSPTGAEIYKPLPRQAVELGTIAARMQLRGGGLTLELERRQNVKIYVRMQAADGEELSNLSVSYVLTQETGGEPVVTSGNQVCNNGQFNFGPVLDYPGTLQVTVDGYGTYEAELLPEKLEPDTGEGDGSQCWNVNFTLTKPEAPDLSARTVTLDVRVDEPVTPGTPDEETPALSLSSFEGLDITVWDETDQKDLTNGEGVQFVCPYISLGQLSAPGHELLITVTSEDYGTVSGTVALGQDGSASLRLDLKKNGKLRAAPLLGVRDVTAMLFDADGKAVSTGSVTGSYTSGYLADGDYTLVLIEKNELVGGASTLEDFLALGFESADYVSLKASVKKGVITVLEQVTVPSFDVTKYSRVDLDATSVTPMFSVITIGQSVDLRAQYTVSERYAGTAATMRFQLGGMTYVPNSLTVDGKTIAPTQNADGMLEVPVNGTSGIVRLRLTTAEPGRFAAAANLIFTDSTVQPIGTATVEAERMSLSVPARTGKTEVTVSGKALANAQVTVYDNGKAVEPAATANGMGDWSLTFDLTLENPGYDLHEIYAVVDGLASETGVIEYYKNYPDVKKVSVVGENIVYDYEHPTKSTNLIIDADDGNALRTYLIEFTHDADKVENVYLNVFNEDGTVVQTKASYDASRRGWVASVYSLPVNVGVEYTWDVGTMKEEDFGDRKSEKMQELSEKLSQTAQEFSEYLEINPNDVKALDDGTIEFGVRFEGMEESSFSMYLSVLDYAEFEGKDLASMNFVKVEANGQSAYTKVTLEEDCVSQTVVLPDSETAGEFAIFLGMEDTTDSGIMTMYMKPQGALYRCTMDMIEKSPIPYLGSLAALYEVNDLRYFANSKYRDANSAIFQLQFIVDSVCPVDGRYRLSEGDRQHFDDERIKLDRELTNIKFSVENALEIYKKRIRNALLWDTATLGLGKLLKSAGTIAKDALGPGAQLLENMSKLSGTWDFFEKNWEIYGAFSDFLDDIQGVELPTSEGGIMDATDVYGSTYYLSILKLYGDLDVRIYDFVQRVVAAYRPCPPDDPKPDPPVDPVKSPCRNTNIIRDPSGYVCEAVPSNRLEGVTATAYKVESGSETLWDAAEYGQENPLTTDSEGRYQWFVPDGEWKVKFHKDGYEDAEAGPVTVPPIQTEVNVAMVSTAAPEVKSVSAFTDGVRVEFSQYMVPESVNVTVTVDGQPVKGMLRPVNLEASFADPNVEYASIYEFVPEEPLTAGQEAKVSVTAGTSYNTKVISPYESSELTVLTAPTGLTSPKVVSVQYGEDDEIVVRVLPGGSTAGLTVTAKSSAENVLTIAPGAVVDDQGRATFKVTGSLPGGAIVTFAIQGRELTGSTQVIVSSNADDYRTAPVTASPASGAVASGTAVTLSTKTPGADIWYTTDGSSPSDPTNTSRKRYTGSIAVTGATTVTAYAVREGYEDSAENTFAYTISAAAPGGSGVSAASRPVTLPETVENGRITADSRNAAPGSTVTLTVKPDEGYVLGELQVTDSAGKAVPLTDNGDGTFTFEMPDSGVTVTVRFKCDGGEACPSRKFTDLDAKAWYHEYTDYVITADLMRGIGGGLFDPNGTVERAQMVTVLWHMQGDPVVNYAMAYSDVDEDDWYAEAVRWAASEGIAGGYGNGLFGPTDPITREQMATMLYHYAKQYGESGFDAGEPYELPFDDAAKVSGWAVEAAVWCSRKGILTGKGNNLLDPAGTAKRCEMAAILMRYCQKATAGEE